MGGEFSAPAADDETRIDVDNEEAPTVGLMTYFAAAMMLVSGMLGAAFAFQMILFIVWFTFLGYVPWVFGALSLVTLVLAGLITLGRPRAVYVALAVSAVQLILALFFNIYALTVPVFSPLGILWLLACFPTLVLVPFALGPATRVAAFRRKLLEGLDPA